MDLITLMDTISSLSDSDLKAIKKAITSIEKSRRSQLEVDGAVHTVHHDSVPEYKGPRLTPGAAKKRRFEIMKNCPCRLCQLALNPIVTFAAWPVEDFADCQPNRGEEGFKGYFRNGF
jgi:hypothetical protein